MREVIKSSNMGVLIVKPVSNVTARELIIANHYSHKWNFGSFGLYNFGVFKEFQESEDECLGVAAYGYMKNPKAKIFTHPNPKAWVCELNRMWISDELGHNSESILISRSIKLLRKIDKNIVAVQSFADGRLGCGTIYKASNFRYYGKHQTIFLENKRTGEVTHQQNLTNTTSRSRYIKDNVAFLLGDFRTFKVDTYRYIYPLCKHFRFVKKEQPYPPYTKGEIAFDWKRDKNSIKDKLHKLINEL